MLQPLANQAQSASARSKPDLVVKVAGEIFIKLSQLKSKKFLKKMRENNNDMQYKLKEKLKSKKFIY